MLLNSNLTVMSYTLPTSSEANTQTTSNINTFTNNANNAFIDNAAILIENAITNGFFGIAPYVNIPYLDISTVQAYFEALGYSFFYKPPFTSFPGWDKSPFPLRAIIYWGPPALESFFLQEDDNSFFELEDGSGFLLLE